MTADDTLGDASPNPAGARVLDSKSAAIAIALLTCLGVILFAIVAPFSGFGAPYNLLVMAAVWWGIVCTFRAAWSRHIVQTVGFAIASFVAVILFFGIEREVLVAWHVWDPPPRPRFSNLLRLHELRLLPDWAEPQPFEDSAGNQFVCDEEDNLVIFASKIATLTLNIPYLRCPEMPGMLVPLEMRKSVTIAVGRDTLFVVQNDGALVEIPIQPGTAKRLDDGYFPYWNNDPPSRKLIDFVKLHLSPSEVQQLQNALGQPTDTTR